MFESNNRKITRKYLFYHTTVSQIEQVIRKEKASDSREVE